MIQIKDFERYQQPFGIIWSPDDPRAANLQSWLLPQPEAEELAGMLRLEFDGNPDWGAITMMSEPRDAERAEALIGFCDDLIRLVDSIGLHVARDAKNRLVSRAKQLRNISARPPLFRVAIQQRTPQSKLKQLTSEVQDRLNDVRVLDKTGAGDPRSPGSLDKLGGVPKLRGLLKKTLNALLPEK